MQQESFQITKKREFKLKCINEAKIVFHSGVLIERAHYYAILAEEWRTIR